MKTKAIILFFALQSLSLDFHGQSTQMVSEEEFISICKTISELEVIREAGLIDDYDGEQTLFFHDIKLCLSQSSTVYKDGLQLKIWHFQDLFVYDINHWIGFLEISTHDTECMVEIRSGSSNKSHSDKPIIGGTLTFKFADGQLKLISEDVEFVE
jgi:hypothetical protein